MKPIICIGAAIVDDSFYCIDEPLSGTSNPATHHRSAGGVARNVAHHLAQLGDPVELISHFGLDADGEWLRDVCLSAGIGISHSSFTHMNTGRFAGILSPSGELYAGAADTHLEEEITVYYLSQRTALLESASLHLIDCNLSAPSIAWFLEFSRTHEIPCVIDPVSVPKASRLKEMDLNKILLITPNEGELAAISQDTTTSNPRSQIGRLIERGVRNIWIRKGKAGSELFSDKETIAIPAPRVEVTDTTGAGDAAMAGWIHAWLRGKSAQECLLYGHALAELILQTRGAYADRLDPRLMESTVNRLRME